MFPINAAFVMILLAVAMAWVPPREWFSSAIVVFTISLVAVACQPEIEGILRGGDINKLGLIGLIWVIGICGFAIRTTWRDFRKPPDAGIPHRFKRNRSGF